VLIAPSFDKLCADYLFVSKESHTLLNDSELIQSLLFQKIDTSLDLQSRIQIVVLMAKLESATIS
jgi:hypothetical protein